MLVEIASQQSAPWFGVPLIAGAFLLLGGFLTFVFTRVNDDRKARREREAKWDEDVLEKGAQLLEAAEAVRDLGLLILRRSVAESVQLVASTGMPLIDEVKLRARRFSLVMPSEFQADFQNFLGWTLILLTPPYQREGQMMSLDRQLDYANALETRLRGLRELEGLLKRPVSGHADLIKKAEKVESVLEDELAREQREAPRKDSSAEAT